MRRKVLFVIWSFSYGGGAERVLSHLVRGLQETGYFDISLLEISHFDKAWEKLPEEVKVLSPVFDETAQGFFARGKRFAKRKLFDLSPAWARRMSRRAGGYDVVVAFNYLLPTFLIYPGEKSISWNHGSIEDLAGNAKRREWQREAYGNVDEIVAIAQRTARSIVDLFPECASKLHIVPNGFPFAEMRRAAAVSVQEHLEPRSLLFVGRLDKNKNPCRAVRMFACVHERVPESHLYFLGEGDELPSVQAEVARCGLTEFVHFLGYRANPYPFIREASCVLSTSSAEGFQTVFVEALCLGVPFISTPVGAAEELSCEGRYGAVLETPDQAAAAFEAFLQKEGDEAYGRAMRKFVERYSVSSQVNAFCDLIDKVLEGKGEELA